MHLIVFHLRTKDAGFREVFQTGRQDPQHCLPIIVEDRHLPRVQKMKNLHRKGLQRKRGWINDQKRSCGQNQPQRFLPGQPVKERRWGETKNQYVLKPKKSTNTNKKRGIPAGEYPECPVS
jgi:hypothetical protein